MKKEFEYPVTPAGLDSAAGEMAKRRHEAGVPLDVIRDRGFAYRPEPHVKAGTEIEFPLKDDPLDGPRYTSDRDGLRSAADELARQRADQPAPQNSIGQLLNYFRNQR
jgi:hypothetical protein